MQTEIFKTATTRTLVRIMKIFELRDLKKMECIVME